EPRPNVNGWSWQDGGDTKEVGRSEERFLAALEMTGRGVARPRIPRTSLRRFPAQSLVDGCLWRVVQRVRAVLGSTALSPSSMRRTMPCLSMTMLARRAH